MIAYDVIKELREERNWSQEQMAERLGMSKNGYAKIERGESLPSLERLNEIAKVLVVSVLELIRVSDKNVVLQTQNHYANYHYNHYASNETLQAENERLKLIIAHKDEIIAQKNESINILKRLANFNQAGELIEL